MNFEQLSLKKAFWRFICPSVIAQWIFALYTMVDGMFVANGVSEVALSAVNIASPFLNFLFSVSILFAVGTSTIVAIYLGQNKKKEANEIYTQNIVLLMVLSTVIMLAVFFNLERISLFLGATDETLAYVKQYIMSILPFSWCFILSYSFETLVKTDGYPKFATIAVTAGCLLNCVLDYLFVMVWKQGVAGAGAATGFSQCVLVVVYLIHFLSPKATIRFCRFQWNFKQILRSIKIGLASFLTEFSAGITVILFNHMLLKYLGNDGIISYTIIAYVNMIVVMSLVGIAQGAQPIISFYYGKGQKEKCRTLFRYGMITSLIVGVIAFATSILGAKPLVNIFISPDLAELRTYSYMAFRIFALSFLVMGINIQISGYFTSVEQASASFAISLGRGIVTIAIALEISTRLFGSVGIWWAPTISEILCGVVTLVLAYRYKNSDLQK